MGVMFASYNSNYQILRLSGTNYPVGTYKFQIDMSVDPTEGGTVDWKGPFNPHASQVRQIIIEDELHIDYANNLFDGLVNCTSIQGINNIRGNLLNTSRMFANTPNLTQAITLSNLISINCLDATEMFAGSGAQDITLANINMKNCTSTKGMFKGAAARNIEMISINTNSVRNADEMFADCTNLEHIYGTSGYFDFGQAISSTDMFANTPNLMNWPIKGYDATGAISVLLGGYIDMGTYSLEQVDVRIQLKYDEKADWLYYDPIPLEGELCIESDTLKFKVGNGVDRYSQLPYMYGFRIDNYTIIEDSEVEALHVPIDNDTIIVDDEGHLKSVEKLHADQITIQCDSEGKLFLDLDDNTIRVGVTGELEAVTDIDDVTIKKSADGLYVPIDGVTIYIDPDDNKIKAKGDVEPGDGLQWHAAGSRVIDVKLGKTLDIDTTGINVNYDGRTIYWDADAGVNGALRGMDVRSADGSVTVIEGSHAWDLSLPLDNDTVVLDGGVIKATAQVPLVDSETIILEDNKLKVNIDNDTLYVEGGKLKAKGSLVDNETIIINSEGKLEAVKQLPDIDEKTIQVKDSKLVTAIDNKTLVYNESEGVIEVAGGRDLTGGRGIYLDEDSETTYINAFVDGVTVKIDSEGRLTADAFPKPLIPDTYLHINCEGEVEWKELQVDVDNKTVIVNSEGFIAVNIDSETIIYDGTHLSVPYTNITYTHGLGAYEDSEGLVVGAHVDNETIIWNTSEDWLQVPFIEFEVTDGIYTIHDSETNVTTFGINVDHDTIVYNSSENWLEVDYLPFEAESSVYLRHDSETDKIFVGLNIDGDTLFINSEGQLCGAPNVLVDDITIIQDSETDIISVHYDHDTIIYNPSEGLAVNGIDTTLVAPIYLYTDSEESDKYYLGCGYDNTTITLNEKNELQTAVGGGWKIDPEERIIANGTNVPKQRHHALPDDDADYFLETVYFPKYLEEGTKVEAKITHSASFMDSTVELKWVPANRMWLYDGRYWDSESGPLDPHGYAIFVYQDETIVRLYEDFEICPDTLTCTIKYGGYNYTKQYIDNQFVKVDDETVYVNSEGELAARLQLQAGKWIQISEGVIGMGKLCQGLDYNEESNCIYVKNATDSEFGGVKIDNETLKVNTEGQVYFDLDNFTDRGLDTSTGKIGHINSFVGELRQAGDPTSTLGIEWDDYGHLHSVERYAIPTYIGASATNNGVAGFVPAAAAGSQKKFLRGDGAWSSLVDSGLFSVISTTGSWYAGTDRRSKVLAASPGANQLVIAPLGFTVDRDVEAIDTIYATDSNLSQITICARSNTQNETLITCTARWLVMNI